MSIYVAYSIAAVFSAFLIGFMYFLVKDSY